jgi:hypothetical protein
MKFKDSMSDHESRPITSSLMPPSLKEDYEKMAEERWSPKG